MVSATPLMETIAVQFSDYLLHEMQFSLNLWSKFSTIWYIVTIMRIRSTQAGSNSIPAGAVADQQQIEIMKYLK